jgi:hypothetical protein
MEMAESLSDGRRALEDELADIEKRKAEIEANLSAAKVAHGRAATFEPEIGGNLQCPRCWIYDGNKVSVRPVPGTDKQDFFRCNKCEELYRFSFR